MDPDQVETIETYLAPYLTTEVILVYPLASFSAMFVLYGIYITLFGLSIRVLWSRNTAISRLYLGLVISLFMLATLVNACEVTMLVRKSFLLLSAMKTKDFGKVLDYLEHDTLKTALAIILNLTNTLMNAITDFMLIHRYYSIWGSSKFILYPLALSAFIINGMLLGTQIVLSIGYSNTSDTSNVNLFVKANTINSGTWIAVAAFNLLLTLLMGGRIWWITREAREVMGKPIQMRYQKIVAVILESGFLYSSTLLIALIVGLVVDPDDHGFVPLDLGVITTQMSAIAPTLIIVRFAYGTMMEGGVCVDRATLSVSTLHFAGRNEGQQRSMTTSCARSVAVHPVDEIKPGGDMMPFAGITLEKV